MFNDYVVITRRIYEPPRYLVYLQELGTVQCTVCTVLATNAYPVSVCIKSQYSSLSQISFAQRPNVSLLQLGQELVNFCSMRTGIIPFWSTRGAESNQHALVTNCKLKFLYIRSAEYAIFSVQEEQQSGLLVLSRGSIYTTPVE